MEKKTVKRYKLVISSTLYRDKEIYTDEDGNNKFTLTEIDALTTEYENAEQFIIANRLNPTCDRLEIIYKAKKQTRYLMAVFSKEEFLKRLSHKNIGKYQVEEDYYFIRELDNICKKIIRDKDLFKYLIDYRYISGTPLISAFNDYITNFYKGYKNDLDYSFKKLLQKLKDYKTVRGIVIGIREYEYKREMIERENPLSKPFNKIPEEHPKESKLPDLTKENYTQGILFDDDLKQKTKKL